MNSTILTSVDVNTSQTYMLNTTIDAKILLYKLIENKEELLTTIETHEYSIVRGMFLNDDEYIVSVDYKSNLVIHHLKNNVKKIFATKVYDGNILGMCGYFDKTINLYLACDNGKIKKIEINKKNEVTEKEQLIDEMGIKYIDMNDNLIIVGTNTANIKLLDRNLEIIKEFDNFKNKITAICIAHQSIFNLTTFAVAGDDKKLIIFSLVNEEYEIQEIFLEEEISTLCFSKTGFCLAVGYGNDKCKTFVPRNGKFVEIELTQES